MSNEAQDAGGQQAEAPTPVEAPTTSVEAPTAGEAATPDEPVAVTEPVAERPKARSGQYHAVGRRKTAVARVYLRPGNGRWKVNGRTFEDYFPRPVLRQAAARPLVVTDTDGQFDVLVNVNGGGLRGQAEAVRLAVSRALLKLDGDFRRALRAEELLTRDAREVERKKPGRPGARKRFQFSKR